MTGRHETPGPPVDDDRLLALALGLGDESDAAAARSDPAVAARLARTRDDIDDVVGRLRATIPDPPEGYADPATDRWPRLRVFFGSPATAAPLRRRGRGRLAATLAAAAVLALVVGIGVVGLGTDADDARIQSSSDGATGEVAGAPAADKGGFGELAATPIVLPEAEHFRAVVVARAGEVVEDVQRFTVIRTLKGRVAGTVALLLHEGAAAMPAGSLEILYLRPLRDYVMATDVSGSGDDGDLGQSADPGVTGVSPAPLASAGGPLPAPAAGYSMDSTDAYVQAVPADVDVTLLSVR